MNNVIILFYFPLIPATRPKYCAHEPLHFSEHIHLAFPFPFPPSIFNLIIPSFFSIL